MEVFKLLNGYDSHALHFVYDRASYLRAIIAIDSVEDSRAVGGIRLREYESEEHAVEEACRLARAMSFKAALAKLPCGGAKTVVYAHPHMQRAAAFRALGDAIDKLGGLYHSGADVGTTGEDLQQVALTTSHVSHQLDFGKHTARGVLAAIQATAKHVDKRDTLDGLRVLVQGLGEVGMELAMLLDQAGAKLVVSDPEPDRCQQAKRLFKADVVDPAHALMEPVDLLAPCALGRILTKRDVPTYGARMIVGSANDVLEESAVAQELKLAGITFVPDFLSSAGALIIGVTELAESRTPEEAELMSRVEATTREVLELSAKQGITPLQAAESLAAERLDR